MMDSDQIFREIQSLPTDARRTLIERIVREIGTSLGELARQIHPEDPFLGLLADEPALADEIQRIAMEARNEGRDILDGDENAS